MRREAAAGWCRKEESAPEFAIESRRATVSCARADLRLTELHSDGDLAQACEALANHLPRNQLIVPAERDMRLDNGVLPWSKPLPDWLHDGALIRRQK
jgi:hypothetical protein